MTSTSKRERLSGVRKSSTQATTTLIVLQIKNEAASPAFIETGQKRFSWLRPLLALLISSIAAWWFKE